MIKLNSAEHRTWLMQEKVQQLMRENPGMSYDTAWTTANAAPEMAEVVAAMKRPGGLTPAAESVTAAFTLQMARNLVSKHDSTANGKPTTAAQRISLVQREVSKWMHQTGKSYDEAFQMVRNDPDMKEVFDAMNNPASTAPEGQAPTITTFA